MRQKHIKIRNLLKPTNSTIVEIQNIMNMERELANGLV